MSELVLPLPVPPTATDSPAAVLDDPLEVDRCTRWSGEGEARTGESALQLAGLHCAACADTIERALCGVDGVLEARVAAASQRATVRWDPRRTRLSRLIAAVHAAGYDAVPDAAAPARALRRREQRSALWRLFVAAFCAMQVMMFATPAYVAAPGELTDDLRGLMNWGGWLLTLPVLFFAAGPFLRAAARQLRSGAIGMDVPVSLGIVVTFGASMAATFDPTGPLGGEVYFDSLTMFLAFLLAGRTLEMRARHRAAEDLERALARMPESAERLLDDGSVEAVSVARLVPGDRVRVALGAAFPADGRLLTGATEVDESLLSGESRPLPRAAGDPVVGGSVNVGGPVAMVVERVGADTRYQAIVAMMRSALTERPEGVRLADRYARAFLWSVLALAGVAALVWSQIDPARAVSVAVAVLIVTCPCALSLAAPAAWVAAAGGLARRGVVFKRLAAIERLAAVDRCCIDKTGTLTEDRLALREVNVVADGGTADTLLALAGSLAAWSRHPLSRALAAAMPAGAPKEDWTRVEEVAGRGLQGFDAAGRCWRLGSAAWLGGGAAWSGVAAAQVGLSCDGRLVATFSFDEALRDDAVAAVAALREADVEVTLLSGDRAERTQAVAQRLGIAAAAGPAAPEDKLAQVARAQAGGHVVAMVGDGINDAPVLARADVSFAMGAGALVAQVHADAVIGGGRLLAVADALATARRALGIVRQNLAWAAAYNAVCVPLALIGWLPPWAAGLGMAASSALVVGNAMRAARPVH